MSNATTFQLIRVEKKDGVGHLQLHRPERLNALSKDMLLEIGSAMADFEQDDDVRVIVLSGAGRGFSSGFDLKDQMQRNPKGPKVWKEILDLDFDTTMLFLAQLQAHDCCGPWPLCCRSF